MITCIWKISVLSGSLLAGLSIVGGWIDERIYAASGTLIIVVPLICMIGLRNKKDENNTEDDLSSQSYIRKVKQLLEQFEDTDEDMHQRDHKSER